MKNNTLILVAVLLGLGALGYLFIQKDATVASEGKLTQTELENLNYLRDEEKLAYDVYQTLGDKWAIKAFQNISNSEERHQSKVVSLLNAYGYEDMSGKLELGKFANKDIENIFNTLTSEGNKSLLGALYVGATIEVLDIKDLDKMMTETKKPDVLEVLQILKSGSENHLSAFKRQIEKFENYDESKLIKLEENNNDKNMQSTKINKENSLMVDVRTKAEFAAGNFPGSVNIPLDELGNNLDIFKNTGKDNIVLVCRSGARAGQAESILKSSGASKNILNFGPWQNLGELK